MSLRLRFLRARALRGVQVLTASSPDGVRVQATGVVRRVDDDPFVPPLAGVPCVVSLTKFYTGPNQARSPVFLERLVIRPFMLETARLDALVDAGHVELLFPLVASGKMQEISIAEGATITVIGSVLRDGVERPTDDIAFRESRSTYKLVGNKTHPVVITASVSDTLARRFLAR